ncbi:histidinol-phosphate transaminase [Chloroflexus sp.]|uniref:histidinol-phosphate transaminase n=1 Tax=Chloroflexus sp. TaxID=1904827 RepID=UPI002ACE202B|nr:histidinol-phosphate transaminase [Chloroflexus sp.]
MTPVLPGLIRPEIADLEAYTPIVPLEVLAARLGLPVERIVKLDANENPYGPAPAALAALQHTATYHIYPDPEQTALRAALAAYTGRPPEEILCGAGADELIDLVLRLIINPGDAIIDCPPTFGMYRFDAGICGGRVITVPRHADFSLDLPAIERAATQGAKAIFLTAPNNPTGNPLPRAELLRVLALPLLVVVDEAYVEFAEPGRPPVGASDLLDHHSNLVVLRTFSKWAGLAGLRVGYGLFPRWLIAQLWKIKQPYNVSVAAQAAAIASLESVAELHQRVQAIVTERDRLFARLREFPFLTPFPSVANFILCRVEGRDARELKLALEQRGVLVRHYRTPLLDGYIRISVGTPTQTDALLTALAEVSQ